jgi:ABC-2 type transport system ATP-binding protein
MNAHFPLPTNDTPCATRLAPDPAALPAFEVKNLCKTYKGGRAPALDHVTLAIPKGVIFGMLGPNGAGKTTLLSILCGLLRPSSGEVRVDGRDVRQEAACIKRVLGVVPQEPAIYPTLTARENLAYFGRMQGLSGERLEGRIRACLEIGDLVEVADEQVGHFSGGFKRRLNLVIGLIHEPQLLILDEPTVAIDPHSRYFIHQRLRELHAAGVTMILSTHILDEAEQLCQEIAIINQGRIVAQGPLDALLKTQRGDSIEVRLERDPPASLADALRQLPGVLEVLIMGRDIRLVSRAPDETVAPLVAALKAGGMAILSLSFGKASLEQFFLSRTENEGGSQDE